MVDALDRAGKLEPRSADPVLAGRGGLCSYRSRARRDFEGGGEPRYDRTQSWFGAWLCGRESREACAVCAGIHAQPVVRGDLVFAGDRAQARALRFGEVRDEARHQINLETTWARGWTDVQTRTRRGARVPGTCASSRATRWGRGRRFGQTALLLRRHAEAVRRSGRAARDAGAVAFDRLACSSAARRAAAAEALSMPRPRRRARLAVAGRVLRVLMRAARRALADRPR